MPPSRHSPQQSPQVRPETEVPVRRLPTAEGVGSPGSGSVSDWGATGDDRSRPVDGTIPAGAEDTASGVTAAEAFRRAEDFRLERDMTVFSFWESGMSAPVDDELFFLEYS